MDGLILFMENIMNLDRMVDVSGNITRVRGITRSVSARRWEGDGFDARPKPRHC